MSSLSASTVFGNFAQTAKAATVTVSGYRDKMIAGMIRIGDMDPEFIE